MFEYKTDENTICIIKVGNSYKKHKCDMETGEWIPVRAYNKKETEVRAKAGEVNSYIWNTNADEDFVPTTIHDAEIKEMNAATAKIETRGRKPKSFDNKELSDILFPCNSIHDAYETFPFLRDTLETVASFSEGGSGSFSVKVIFDILKHTEEVTTAAISVLTGYSKSYCEKLYSAAYVSSMQLMKKLKDFEIIYKKCEIESMIDKDQITKEREEYISWFIEEKTAGKYKDFPIPK